MSQLTPAAAPPPHFWRVLLALVWLINGLLAKVLLLVPRHALIVARILGPIVGPAHAEGLTRLIGLGEVGLGLWVLSGRWPCRCGATQMALVALMNLLEAWLAPDLLLWGRLNALFAALFVALVGWVYFGRGRKHKKTLLLS